MRRRAAPPGLRLLSEAIAPEERSGGRFFPRGDSAEVRREELPRTPVRVLGFGGHGGQWVAEV